MQYNYIIEDVSNLFYRVKNGLKTSEAIVRKMITIVEQDLKSHLKNDGIIYLVFDVMPNSDLGISKTFQYTIERKKILPDYKANRQYSPLFLGSINVFKDYYLYRGENIQLVYSDEHEADDFVEPLIEMLNGTIAIHSTDFDNARYISDRVQLINDHWDKPYTINEFKTTFQFDPTPATVTFYKAAFGDKSDNIQGAINVKKAKFSLPIKEYIRDFLIEIGKTGESVEMCVDRFKKANYNTIIVKTDKTIFEKLFLSLKMADVKAPVFETLFRNISIIKSQLANKDIKSYIHWQPVREEINNVIHNSIFEMPFIKTFGKV